jgi:membrane protease YdiL (CAAX protease family)
MHGYLNPRDWPIALYGMLMVLVVAGMGYLYDYSGLFAAMAAHTLIDVAIFTSLRYFPGPSAAEPDHQDINREPPSGN